MTTAIGVNSHAEGGSSTAGIVTISIGNQSHAEGDGTKAVGDNSHSEGFQTIANGLNSHAEGYLTLSNSLFDHAEGFQSTASGGASHSEGFTTQALGLFSHAEGNTTTSSSTASHSQGISSVAYHNAEDAQASGFNSAPGDAQRMVNVLRNVITGAVSASLYLDGVAGTLPLTIPVGTSWKFTIDLVARDIATGDMLSRQFQGAIKNVGGVTTVLANTLPVASYLVQSAQDGGLPTADAVIDLAASTAANALVITATSEALKTINWVASVELVQVQ